jgi:hypothetical protein
MEDITMSGVQLLTGYGALGGVCLWLMWMHTTSIKKLNDALTDFTVALKVLTGKADD